MNVAAVRSGSRCSSKGRSRDRQVCNASTWNLPFAIGGFREAPNESGLDCQANGTCGSGTKPLKYVTPMHLDRFLIDAEQMCNLLVSHTVHHQTQHLTLTISQVAHLGSGRPGARLQQAHVNWVTHAISPLQTCQCGFRMLAYLLWLQVVPWLTRKLPLGVHETGRSADIVTARRPAPPNLCPLWEWSRVEWNVSNPPPRLFPARSGSAAAIARLRAIGRRSRLVGIARAPTAACDPFATSASRSRVSCLRIGGCIVRLSGGQRLALSSSDRLASRSALRKGLVRHGRSGAMPPTSAYPDTIRTGNVGFSALASRARSAPLIPGMR